MSAAAIDVYWHECRHSDIPADDSWLASNELAVLRAFRVPKRREDWRLGRWTAKRAVASYLHLPANPAALAAIEVRAADSGAPEVFLPDRPAPVSISITHCNGSAACAVTQAGVLMGCDLEAIEPRSDAFIADYFTSHEQTWIARSSSCDRVWLANLIWSAKESALKALREGLRLDTRSVEVQPQAGAVAWSPLVVLAGKDREFHGWWRRDEHLLRTVVASPAPRPPLSSLG